MVSNYHDVPAGSRSRPPCRSNWAGWSPSGKATSSIVSIYDYPFADRAAATFNSFEREALATLQRDPGSHLPSPQERCSTASFGLVAPILMERRA